MDALAYANMCFSSGGFTSYAPPPLTDSCKPGFIVRGCKSARRYTTTFTVAGSQVLKLDPFESYQVIAIVDRASSASVTLDDWVVDGESLFTKVENEQPAGSAFSVVPGLGAVVGLDPELYRSGLNPLPPQPFIDNTHSAFITFTGAIADVADFFVYFGNPPSGG